MERGTDSTESDRTARARRLADEIGRRLDEASTAGAPDASISSERADEIVRAIRAERDAR